ncbi:hypothetical protein [Rosistilla carotiformis]|uniref:hypothetical protein n=1 Tax=Rosistilla carotiformis TaxID=2528017 RepID=UPI001E61CE57|nr:hypothetical protein [Rosistilla carotiformis]
MHRLILSVNTQSITIVHDRFHADSVCALKHAQSSDQNRSQCPGRVTQSRVHDQRSMEQHSQHETDRDKSDARLQVNVQIAANQISNLSRDDRRRFLPDLRDNNRRNLSLQMVLRNPLCNDRKFRNYQPIYRVSLREHSRAPLKGKMGLNRVSEERRHFSTLDLSAFLKISRPCSQNATHKSIHLSQMDSFCRRPTLERYGMNSELFAQVASVLGLSVNTVILAKSRDLKD